MSPAELETVLLENPDQPHRLTLASGDQVILRRLRDAFIEGLGMRIYDRVAEDRITAKSSRYLSIPNIVLVELLDERSPPTPRPADRGEW